MIYLFYGTDKNKTRAKYDALLAALARKSPEASLFVLTQENFSSGKLEELSGGQTLFYGKYLVACDNLLGQEEIFEEIKKSAKALRASDNLFVFLENENLKEGIKLLGKLSEKSQEINLADKEKKEAFNIFSLTDAVAERNPTRAWSLYQEALRRGVGVEEVLWKLVWQIKNLLLVKTNKNSKELKLSPFVLRKAQAGAAKFEEKELASLSGQLVSIYHDTFPGSEEMEVEIENLLIKL